MNLGRGEGGDIRGLGERRRRDRNDAILGSHVSNSQSQ